jgi:hypothetical protein
MKKFARLCNYRTIKAVADKMTNAPWFKEVLSEGAFVIRHVTIGQTTHFWTCTRHDLLRPSRAFDASHSLPSRLSLAPQIGYKLCTTK